MRAAYYEAFQQPLSLQDLPEPAPADHGAVIRVGASGLCRSDWHGWMGHDPDITPPHVPGHEFAGVIAALGKYVRGWQVGERVTSPFVCACGTCAQCLSGNHQVCERQTQPGFTHFGSFAEYVAVDHAEVNLVRLPEALDDVTAASLGCRFATSFRAVVDQARVRPGEWVAVHGCGGVGLSAVMIAQAVGAKVVGVDIADDKLALARSVGAAAVVNAAEVQDVVAAVVDITGGGAHVSIDALGSPQTCFNSVANLRRRGRQVQVGLMTGDHRNAAVPMNLVIARELELLGSHGMQAYRYPALLAMIGAGRLRPDLLVGKRISLEESLTALVEMDSFRETGVTVIDRF
ncbi:MAG TPA: zinc-dependent alcohol dehydrogenase family protein [bacterium]